MDITPSLNLACVHVYISASTSVFMHVFCFFLLQVRKEVRQQANSWSQFNNLRVWCVLPRHMSAGVITSWVHQLQPVGRKWDVSSKKNRLRESRVKNRKGTANMHFKIVIKTKEEEMVTYKAPSICRLGRQMVNKRHEESRSWLFSVEVRMSNELYHKRQMVRGFKPNFKLPSSQLHWNPSPGRSYENTLSVGLERTLTSRGFSCEATGTLLNSICPRQRR